jgi:hypothetical protein
LLRALAERGNVVIVSAQDADELLFVTQNDELTNYSSLFDDIFKNLKEFFENVLTNINIF